MSDALKDKKRVVIGLSGGVDSSVAAYLLKQSGYQVIGVTLRTWRAESGAYSRCCEISDARLTANQLEIPFYNINSLPEFEKHVTYPFMDAYLSGTTPNPCVDCNRYVKWEGLLKFADEIGADYVATGHYARVLKTKSGRYTVKQAQSAAKDQTYMLYRLTQDQLSRTLMPLADYTKEEVRRIASEQGLGVASKKDSQEICFVLDGGYADYIDFHTEGNVPPPGDFVDLDGTVIGTHKGIIHYTVGQRKGLGLALGYPAYVKQIDPATNRVVIGDEASVYESEIICRNLNFLAIEDIPNGDSIRAMVKIRYHHKAAPANITRIDQESVKVVFDEAVKAPAPGQSAVFYDNDMGVIGGGVIVAK